MSRKIGQSRLQFGLFATPLEEMISENNPVRVIDAFVDTLDLEKLGFSAVRENRMGAASFAPADLLKIYFYGYFNRIRSSRCLERECARNVEMMWLTNQLSPSYHTISTFRTLQIKDEDGKILFNHRKALVQVFRIFNQFCDKMGLFGKTLFAVDGTKIAAQNSKKRHISEDKITRKLDRVNLRIEEYLQELDTADGATASPEINKKSIETALAELNSRKNELENQKILLKAAHDEDINVTQICLTDPDARMLPINNEGMMQIAYNVQSVVDAQHCLIADFSVENQKDLYLLAPMSISVKKELQIDADTTIEMLADKGYHSAKGLQECAENNIITYVAFPEQTYKDRPKGFQKKDFVYDTESDFFTCPNKEKLQTTGTLHGKKGRGGHEQPRYKLYRCSFTICNNCPFRDQCLSDTNIEQRHGRTIERGEFEEAALANRKRILAHRDKYKRRQAIVEHPFGTIKRSWGCYFTLLKGKEKVSGEFAIVFTVYNLRRVINILGVKMMINALKSRVSDKNALCVRLCGTYSKNSYLFVGKTGFGSEDLAAFGVAA